MKRALVALSMGLALFALAGPAAWASHDPHGGGHDTTLGGGGTNNAVDPGGSVTFTIPAGTCTPGSTVTVTVNGQSVGTTTCSSDGNGSFTVTAPDLPSGCYSVVARDPSGNQSTGVLCISGGAVSSLAFTGSNTWQLVGIGAALLVVGLGIAIFARRLRRARRLAA